MLKHTTRNFGGLNCHVIEADRSGAPPRQVVVFCHGFGAGGTDLVPLAGELFAADADWGTETRFVFPEAPLSLDQFGLPGGRAWWMIDMVRLTQLDSPDTLRQFVTETPEGMNDAVEQLDNAVAEMSADAGLDISRCIVGGFSQGSMVATQLALTNIAAPAGLCILSGMLVNADSWTQKVADRRGLAVFQSHGTQDPLLPIQGAEWLRDLMQNAGLEVEFHPFPGGHTIPEHVMSPLAKFLQRL